MSGSASCSDNEKSRVDKVGECEMTLRLVPQMKCPKCGNFHEVDQLYEKAGIALDCDTFGERVPLGGKAISPEDLQAQLGKLVREQPEKIRAGKTDNGRIFLEIPLLRF
ncbi:MAG: hypothetical protein WBK04_02510 [Bacillota bacterium]|jgi:hypothetical protein